MNSSDAIAYAYLKSGDALEAGGGNWKGFKVMMEQAFDLAEVFELIKGEETRPADGHATLPAWRTKERHHRSLCPRVLGFLLGKYELKTKNVYKTILASLNHITARNNSEIPNFLQLHETLLANARKSQFPLVADAPALADDAAKERIQALHMCYSDRILAHLPETTEWKTFSQIYDTDDTSSHAPKDVLDHIRAHYTAGQARSTNSAQNALLGTTSTSTSGTALASTSASSSSPSAPKCSFCNIKNPRHNADKCWSNPSNPENKLGGKGGKGSGKGKVKKGGAKAAAAATSTGEESDDASESVMHLTIAATTLDRASFSHDPDGFYLDSCATRSIAHSRSSFLTYTAKKEVITTANGSGMTAVGKGDVELACKVGNQVEKVILKGVLHVPSSAFNLVSLPRCLKAGAKANFKADLSFSVDLGGKTIFTGAKHEYSLPKISLANTSPVANALLPSSAGRLDLVERYHLIYGHPGKNAMRNLLKVGAMSGFSTADLDAFFEKSCPACRMGKSTRLPFPVSISKAKLPFESLHADLAGPFRFESWSGCKYFLIIVDEASGYVAVEPMKDKGETTEKARTILSRLKVEFKEKDFPTARTFRTDNGSEFTSSSFASLLSSEGFSHQRSVPYTPQQNGRAERFVRTMKEKITTLLISSGLSRRWWAETAYYAEFVLNATPYVPNNGETPFHFIHNTENSFFHSKTPAFGQQVWVNNPNASTFEDKAIECYFLGVGAGRGVKGFRIQPVGAKGGAEVRWAKDVYFEKGDIKKQVEKNVDDDEDFFLWGDENLEDLLPTPEQEPSASPPTPSGSSSPSPSDNVPQPPKEFSEHELGSKWGADGGKRVRKPTKKAASIALLTAFDDANEDDDEGVVLAYRNGAVDNDDDQLVLLSRADSKKLDFDGRPPPTLPASVEEALSGPYSPEWHAGMKGEVGGYSSHGAWALVPFTPGMNLLGCRWHLTIREDGGGIPTELKSRLVIQGVKTLPFLSQYGPSYTPLPNWGVVSFFFVIVVENGYIVYCTDFKKGYLCANVAEGDDPIYVKQPPGFEVKGKEDWVYRLDRAAYGVPQSGRALHLRVKAWMSEISFVAVSDEVTLYVGKKDGKNVVFLIYVDDGLAAGQEGIVELFLADLTKEFDVSVRGTLDDSTFLGREIHHDRINKTITVLVESHISRALEAAGMQSCKVLHLPIQPGVDYLSWTGEAVRKTEYLSLVGRLLFISHTRPDIQYAVNIATRFSSNPGPAHWSLIHRILAYLSGTKKVGLQIKASKSGNAFEEGLKVYVDSDFAGDPDSRKSTSGGVVQLGDSTISTFSRRQPIVSTSTYRAKLYAISTSLTQLEIHSSLLSSYIGINNSPLLILNDNLSAVDKVNSPTFSEQAKHLDVKVKYVREQIEKGFVELRWIPGAQNLADLLTKPLPAKRAKELGEKLGLVGWPSGKEKWGSR